MLIDEYVDGHGHTGLIGAADVIEHIFLAAARARPAPAIPFGILLADAQRREYVRLRAVDEAGFRQGDEIVEFAAGQLLIGIIFLKILLHAVVHGHEAIGIAGLARIVIGLEQSRRIAEIIAIAAVDPPGLDGAAIAHGVFLQHRRPLLCEIHRHLAARIDIAEFRADFLVDVRAVAGVVQAQGDIVGRERVDQLGHQIAAGAGLARLRAGDFIIGRVGAEHEAAALHERDEVVARAGFVQAAGEILHVHAVDVFVPVKRRAGKQIPGAVAGVAVQIVIEYAETAREKGVLSFGHNVFPPVADDVRVFYPMLL